MDSGDAARQPHVAAVQASVRGQRFRPRAGHVDVPTITAAPKVAPAPAPAMAAAAAAGDPSIDFDFGDLSLDLDKSAHASHVVEVPEVPELDMGAARRQRADGPQIELADEFRRIGDHEGARELLEEVVSKAEGPLKSRAQTMLDALG